MPHVYTITTEGAEALVAAAAETVLQLRGLTTVKASIVAWGVSFDGVTAAAVPVTVELLKQTTDGTATAATEVAADDAAPAAVTTGFHTFTVEPTAGAVFEQHFVHPQGGNLTREYPPGREPKMDKAVASRWGIRVTAPAVVNVVAWLAFEE